LKLRAHPWPRPPAFLPAVHLFAGIADLAPLGESLAGDAEVGEYSRLSIRTPDTARVTILPRHLPARLPSVDLVSHPNFGAGDDAAGSRHAFHWQPQ
jgi:hypothetical protein